jgi:SNF2 family DNA or RNA helicase
VTVYRTIARNTIEGKVVTLARRKAALFIGVMDEGDLFVSSLTAEDIRARVSDLLCVSSGLMGGLLD